MAVYSGTAMSTLHSGNVDAGAGYQVTHAEQVLPEIAYVHGVETPFLATIGRGTAHNRVFDFILGQIDEDRPLPVTAGSVEFKDWSNLGTDSASRYRLRGHNYTMIHERFVGVSDSQRTTREFGVPDEYTHQLWETAISFGMDWEHFMLWTRATAGVPGAINAGTGQQTAGAVQFAYDTGVTATPTIAGTEYPAYWSSTYYKGTGNDITRDELVANVLQPFWEKGGELDRALAFVGTKVKNVISQFSHLHSGSGPTLSATPLNERSIPAGLHKIVDKVDVYEGDWGRLFVVKNRNMANSSTYSNFGPSGSQNDITPNTSMLLFEPQFFELMVKEAVTAYDLPKLGHGQGGVIVGEMGLACRNPRATAIAYDIAA